MGQVEIPVGTVEHNDVEIGIVLDEAGEVAELSATVVAVIVLIGGWSNVTWQYLGLRRSTLKCVQDRYHASESRALLDGPVSIVFMSYS